MPTIVLNGHPTWVLLPKKSGTPLVLAHGGHSSSDSLLRTIGPRLSRHFPLAAFDRRGHGRTADTAEPFGYDAMASELIAFLEYLGRPCHVLGRSDGGIASLIAAVRRPDLFVRHVVVGSHVHVAAAMPMPPFDVDTPAYEAWAQGFAAANPGGLAAAREVFRKTAVLHETEPTLEMGIFADMTVPTLVMVGDDDVMRLEHAVELYETLDHGQLCVLPGTSHGLLHEETKLATRVIRRFLSATTAPQTRMPLRRLPQGGA